MRIMISSNAPFGYSGYSIQGKHLSRALQELGHDVSYYAWYGLETGRLMLGGATLYPRIEDNKGYGVDAYKVAQYDDADLLISIQDVWPLPRDFGKRCQEHDVKWAAWYPIDGDPLVPGIKTRLESCDYPIVYSQYGERVSKEGGINSKYVPLGYDPAIFYPVDKKERDRLRASFDLPINATVFSVVAANIGYPSRKSWPEILTAFARYREQVDEQAILYLLTDMRSQAKGYYLDVLGRQLNIPRHALRNVHQLEYKMGLPDQFVADIMRASDCLLSPSMGEGFGVPIVEAQACGTYVITQDCTSMSELTSNGEAIEPLQPFYTLLGHWQYTASIDRIYQAMVNFKNIDGDERERLCAQGIEHVSNYKWATIRDRFWRQILESIEIDASFDSEPSQLELA